MNTTLKTWQQLPKQEQTRLKNLAKEIGYKEMDKNKVLNKLKRCVGLLALFLLLYTAFVFTAEGGEITYSDEQIADAIYLAEGGAKTNHPYGILTKYKTTTPRQACINTIRHARKDWDGKGDFIEFLGSRYAPIGAKNDPTGLNKNWVCNVKYFLTTQHK